MDRLAAAHVVVLGVGGVGSFAAEALVRAGVGRVTLVDGERVDETNANRQLHALDGAFGELKVVEMAARLVRVNPAARVDALPELYCAASAERLVPPGASFVVDAMDTVVAKLHVIQRCLELGIPIVTSLGAARRLDPTAIQVTDLCESHTDQLAKDVRKYLRRRHGISRRRADRRARGLVGRDAARDARVAGRRRRGARRTPPRAGGAATRPQGLRQRGVRHRRVRPRGRRRRRPAAHRRRAAHAPRPLREGGGAAAQAATRSLSGAPHREARFSG